MNAPALSSFVSAKFGEIRAMMIDGDPWFVAKDVARSLGYKNTREAVGAYCKGSSDLLLPSGGGAQKTKIIPKSDLYRLILRSKLPAAEAFQDWVTEEVLPSIRRTGAYVAPVAAGEGSDGIWLTREEFGLLLKAATRPVNVVRSLPPASRALAPSPAEPQCAGAKDVAEFVAAACVWSTQEVTTSARLYEAFVAWTRQRGKWIMSRHAFGRALRRAGVSSHRTGSKRGWFVMVKGGAA